jgi:hypothetical protein
VELAVIPADWPLAERLLPLAVAVIERLELAPRLRRLELIPDALAADDRSWLRLTTERGEDPATARANLTLWFHPDQVLKDRPGHGAAQPEPLDWKQAPAPRESAPLPVDEFSAPNAQRFLYLQLLLVQVLMDGRLRPEEVPPSLIEAFQEAWQVTVDGRLAREGLPHLSAAERRMRFLRLFSPAGVVTPNHWAIFNGLWEGQLADQAAVLAKVRLLPPLNRRRRI